MKFVNILLLLSVITIAFACSHTNKLSQYDLNNKNVYFKQIEEPNAKEVIFEFVEVPMAVNGDGEEQVQIDVKADAGANVISTSIEKRFMEEVDSDKLLDYIVSNLQTSISDVYNVKLEESITPLTDFIIETKLTKCLLAASNTE